jgi:hypothetical protein
MPKLTREQIQYIADNKDSYTALQLTEIMKVSRAVIYDYSRKLKRFNWDVPAFLEQQSELNRIKAGETNFDDGSGFFCIEKWRRCMGE